MTTVVMFKKRRAKLIAEITAAVMEALAKQQPAAKPNDLDLVGKFFGETLSGMGSFMTGASELALRSSASLLGQRGGIAKARNRAAKKNAPPAKPLEICELCEDPLTRNVTIPMILEHRKHEASKANARAAAATVQHSRNGSEADVSTDGAA